MMDICRKSLLISLLTGLSLVIACRKDKAVTEIPSKIIPPAPALDEKVFIPIQLGTGKSSMLFSYTADQALSEIEYADGSKAVLSYNTKGKPSKFQRYSNKELIFTSMYKLDENELVVRASLFAVKDSFDTPIGYYILTYDTSRQLAGITYYENNGQMRSEQQKTFSPPGNLTNEKSNTPGLMTDYSYDVKNGLFKNVNYAWLFAVEKENPLLLSAVNNIQQCTFPLKPENNQTFDYTYNTQSYPETVKTTVNGITSSATVIYKGSK